MSKEIDDGGDAFPCGNAIDVYQGMSLRDYFAGQMLAGVYANSAYDSVSLERIASSAYKQADAIIEARKGGYK